MTVAELVEQLQQYPPDYTVVIHDPGGPETAWNAALYSAAEVDYVTPGHLSSASEFFNLDDIAEGNMNVEVNAVHLG